MIYAYDETLLAKAQIVMARMLDYAVHEQGITLTDFFDMFLASDYSLKFADGNSSVIAGMSGIELAYFIILENDESAVFLEPSYSVARSPEYWVGYVLAYYQWLRNKPFQSILGDNSIADVLRMYSKYHEMDILQTVDALDTMCADTRKETALKRFRMYVRLSQRELAEKSEIPLRTIQQYEQRQKNINHAKAEYLIRLAKALYCRPEDLLE